MGSMDNVNYTPYPFQKVGINFLERVKYGLLADDMGLGKTMQSIIASRNSPHVLVICPAHLRLTWAEEIKKVLKVTSVTILGSKNRKLTGYSGLDQYNIISVGQMKYLSNVFQNFHTIIIDEVHMFRIRPESNAQLKQCYRYLMYYLQCWKPEYMYLLSGTPILNHIGEFYYIFKAWSLLPTPEYKDCLKYYSNPQYFLSNFCFIKYKNVPKGQRVSVVGSRNEAEMKQYLSQRYLRRETSEVLDLPPIVSADVPTDNTTTQDNNLLQAWNMFNGEEISPIITSAKVDSAINKALFTTEFVRTLPRKNGFLVFTEYKQPAQIMTDELVKKGRKVVCITGETPVEKRATYVKMFQAGQLDGLVCTIMSMNTGHTITRAKYVVFNDLHWTPAQNKQALKRANRIGSADTTFVYYTIGSKIDKLIRKTLANKEYMINQVI